MYIDGNTSFEKIATEFPYLIGPLLEMGIKVIVCGDIKWGTLEEEIKKLGLNLEEVLEKLNAIVEENGGPKRHIKLEF
ncbi:hypothetical protein JYK00_09710 [Thermosipho ferrireducens]|uniref:Uncharacterized protein n=1 Tax=Thermosipho ferrireducens TaxID=2571116 RepID=A0ABX7S7T5_9BACT|nr:hypothetical protein [Thermosipho ferrireducens]QTA37973.1 hypothetical protein JYK00_09710 [Thermosipho ferrireducens]